MGALLAAFGDQDNEGLGRLVERMVARSPYRGEASCSTGPGLAIGIMAHGQDASLSVSGDQIVAFHGYLGNRRELLRRFASTPGGPTTDAEIVALGYRRAGAPFLRELRGEFAVVVFERPAHRLLVARDVVGCRPLFAAQTAGALLMATEARQLVAGIGGPARLDEASLVRQLCGLAADGSETLFEGVRRVRPGHVTSVRWDDSGPAVESAPLWEPPPARAEAEAGDDLLARELRHALTQAVDRCRPERNFAVALSGGLDSGSVWAAMTRPGPEEGTLRPPRALSLTYPGWACDESSAIAAILRSTGGEGESIDVSRARPAAYLQAVYGAIDHLAVPTAYNIAFLTNRCRDTGLSALVTGLGGDEWLDGSYDHPRDDFWHGRPLRGLSDALHLVLPEGHNRVRFVCRTLLTPRIGATRLLGSGHPPGWLHCSRRLQFRAETQVRIRDRRHRGVAWSRQRLLAALEARQGSDSLDSLEQIAAQAQVELRHPLMDADLVGFCFSAPARSLTGGRVWKGLLRRAMEGSLPGEILASTRFGALDSLLASDRDETLSRCEPAEWSLVRRGIVDREWLDNARLAGYTLSVPSFLTLTRLLCAEAFSRQFD